MVLNTENIKFHSFILCEAFGYFYFWLQILKLGEQVSLSLRLKDSVEVLEMVIIKNDYL